MIKIIVSLLLFFIIFFQVIKPYLKYVQWNNNFKDGYDEKHSLYLNYKELKDFYFLNPDRWFWEQPVLGKINEWFLEESKSNSDLRLFYDISDAPQHSQLTYTTTDFYYRQIYRDSVSRVYLTYPAYRLAIKLEKDRVKLIKQNQLEENRKIFLETCQQDINRLLARSQQQINAAHVVIEQVKKNLNK